METLRSFRLCNRYVCSRYYFSRITEPARSQTIINYFDWRRNSLCYAAPWHMAPEQCLQLMVTSDVLPYVVEAIGGPHGRTLGRSICHFTSISPSTCQELLFTFRGSADGMQRATSVGYKRRPGATLAYSGHPQTFYSSVHLRQSNMKWLLAVIALTVSALVSSVFLSTLIC